MFIKDLLERGKKLLLTIIGKKWVALILGTFLLLYGKIGEDIWLVLCLFVIGANAYEKKNYLNNDKGK